MEIFDLIYSSKYEKVKAWVNSETTNKSVVDSAKQTPLLYAILYEKERIAKLFVKKNLYIFEVDDIGDTPLHDATKWGYTEIVLILIQKGAIVNALNEEMCLPIHWAARCGHSDIIRILIESGSEINAIDKYGVSPLGESIFWNDSFEGSKTLLDEGAALFNDIKYLKFAQNDNKTLVKYHLKLQAFVLACRGKNALSQSAILRFSQTFKISFK